MRRTQHCPALELVGVKDADRPSSAFKNVGGRTSQSLQEQYGRLPAKSNHTPVIVTKQFHKRKGFTKRGFLLVDS